MARFLILALLSGVVLMACDNQINIATGYEEEVFITGLLDAGDTVHYLRIQKSFLDPDSSPYILLSDPYNSYFKENDLDVWMESWKDGALTGRYTFEYIDGDSIGISKDAGIFPASPNILYRLKSTLDAGAEYRLFVHRIAAGDTITASTVLVQSFNILFPVSGIYGLNFADTNKIQYANAYAVHARIYDLTLRFDYTETDLSTGVATNKHHDWVMFNNHIGDNDYGSGVMAYEMRANQFFTFISTVIWSNPNVERTFTGLSFTFYAGGEELYLQYLNNLANLGFGELYATTSYTNIQGAYGIFSSVRKQTIDSIFLSDRSLDTLACGYLTSGLGFIPSTSHSFYPNCQ
jgi:hypothetical protein